MAADRTSSASRRPPARSRAPTAPDGPTALNPLTALVGVLATLLWVGLGVRWTSAGAPDPTAAQPADRLVLLLVLLAVGFLLTEAVQLHVELRGQALSLSLSEIPLVVGLFLVPPAGLLACRLLGLVVVAVRRRSPSYKLVFNAATVTAEIGLLCLVFEAAGGRRDGLQASPGAWLAAYAALLAGTLVAGGLVVLAISRLSGVARADLLGLGAPLVVSSLVNTTVALAALVLLQEDLRTSVLIGVLLLGGTIAYRTYGELLRRHRSLAQLQQLTEAWSAADGVRDVVAALLGHGRGLLRAGHVEIDVRIGDDRLAAGHATDGEAPRDGTSGAWEALLREVQQTGSTVLVRPRRGDPDRSAHDAICVPLRSAGETVGALLVADRVGDTSTFDREDVHLVELVATQAAVALQNGRLIDRLRHDATHDALTDLPNRAAFRTAVEGALARDERFSVLIMDLDGFKDVNDTLGHHHGDELLRAVAARLRAGLPDDVLVARLGGDEFAVLVHGGGSAAGPAGGSPDGGVATAQRLHEALGREFRVDGVDLDVRASVGVSVAPDDGQDVATLLKRADIAMYEAKAAGALVQAYDAAADRSSARRLALVAELRDAIDQGRLTCSYQPQLDLRAGVVVGAEALVRWPHPELGVLLPDEFVPVAEQTGLVVPLTAAVLRQALQQAADWPQLTVAVNVSPRGLLAPGFADGVLEVLQDTGTAPGRLTLEITENSVMADPGQAVRVLRELHGAGVQLSVDDFGTGYSSLAYLQRLPVDEVKIDKSFVQGMGLDRDRAAIVRAIVDMGHVLGLRVLAEGVEDESVARLLRELGCDLAQGYLYSRPLPAPEFTAWSRRAGVHALRGC